MAIDKALNQAPLGLAAIDPEQEGPDLEIEIEDPESVNIKTGDMEIELEPGDEGDDEFNANLADEMDEKELTWFEGRRPHRAVAGSVWCLPPSAIRSAGQVSS